MPITNVNANDTPINVLQFLLKLYLNIPSPIPKFEYGKRKLLILLTKIPNAKIKIGDNSIIDL